MSDSARPGQAGKPAMRAVPTHAHVHGERHAGTGANAHDAAADRDADDATGFNAERMLKKLEWTVLRRLDGLLQGNYRTLFRGFGMDLADLREYQPQDDVRYIDWNVTARMHVPFVREFQEDREITAWFLLDLSGSVDFGSRRMRKRTLAAEFTGLMARLLTRHGNRIGAILFCEGRHLVVPPRASRRHVLHVLDRLLAFRSPGKGNETDLAELLKLAQSTVKRRSVLFVVSDFISRPGWGRGLSLLARRHEVVAVRLYDPLEMELPDLGLIVLQDAETGEQMVVDTHDRKFRERFAAAAEKREADLRAGLAEAAVDCLELCTDDNLDEAVLHFTRLRKRRSQLASGGLPRHVLEA